ncbi:peptidoglycan editing factor PgeF [Edaphobacter albus]|uniref:peptidoglycan editing factor PgeF n=1 Tax=Edaphobacter sp. 4G125 TaxID=2763071 RepID=UPI0016448E13|nr:peptidoglycan editing factor PgeF [Edaphobacter sp. 4G125]QNI36004.1 peptidoglycan editing factor PgeF [Edaphobacter sp. 4G125]
MAEIEVIQIPQWQNLSWLRHGFSTRSGGVSAVYGTPSLNLGWTKEDDPAKVAENRRLLVEQVGRVAKEEPPMKLVTVRQVHGNVIHRVKAKDAWSDRLETPEGKAVLEGDGLVTNDSGILLGAGTADCVPVLLVNAANRTVGAFHAGWRGTAARIVQHGVEVMRREFGSRPEDLLAAVGPSIGSCCYTVGEEVREKFGAEFPYAAELFHVVQAKDGAEQLRVDLWEANRRQLMAAGVSEERITVVAECTSCAVDRSGQRKYFSHRADAGRTGRMLNMIGIVESGQQGR